MTPERQNEPRGGKEIPGGNSHQLAHFGGHEDGRNGLDEFSLCKTEAIEIHGQRRSGSIGHAVYKKPPTKPTTGETMASTEGDIRKFN